jgi:3D (Asp-Asp-Asp) domain-containing protein
LKVYSIFSGSALIAATLLSSSLLFTASTSSAETRSSQEANQTQQQTSKPATTATDAAAPVTLEVSSGGKLGKTIAQEEQYVVAPAPYVATAYSLRGRTASGQMVAKGVIAADPRHLPLGSRVRIEAGPYSGEYLVADTGSMVRGRRIDIWTPSSREAMRFGRRTVKLTVLSLGRKKRAPRT